MANDGTLNQRESGVGIFDAMTFQNEAQPAPLSDLLKGSEKEEENRMAHEAAYGDNDNQPDPEGEAGAVSMPNETTLSTQDTSTLQHGYDQPAIEHSPEFGYEQPAIAGQSQNTLEAEFEEVQPEQGYQGVFGYGSAERQEGMSQALEQEAEATVSQEVETESQLEAE